MIIGEKTKYFIKIIVASFGVYFVFKYMLVLFMPFIVAYTLAFFLTPIVNYVTGITGIKRGVVAFVVLGLVVVILGLFVVLIVTTAVNQLVNMINNSGYYESVIQEVMDDTCCMVERYFGVNKNKVYEYVSSYAWNIWKGHRHDTILKLMDTSAMTVVAIIKVIVFVFTAIVSTFYMIVSREEIRRKKNDSIFYKEITAVMGNVYKVSVAYVRTQLVIMLFTTIICYGGLLLIHNPYALIIAMAIGALDALPLFGAGAILIPWGVILLIMGNYFHAIVIFLVFIICYVFREIAEPRLMGQGIGISPLMTIVSMYVGFELFGMTGVILGPIAYVILRTIITP